MFEVTSKPSLSSHIIPPSIFVVVEESIHSPSNLANPNSLANGPLPLALSNNDKVHELHRIPLGVRSIQKFLSNP